MKTALLLSILALPVVTGVFATRIWIKRKERGNIANRLAQWVDSPEGSAAEAPLTILKKQAKTSSIEALSQLLDNLPGLEALKSLLWQAGLEDHISSLLILEGMALIAPPLIAFALGLDIPIAGLVSVALCVLPILVLKNIATTRRNKFCELLPNAIDLMVAVLRSGHSIPQAVKAVAQESPKPCGQEFEAVLQRLNFGQPLSESLTTSAKRFESYELDLMRRAVAIQSEVGGSLAELLDKTNVTLRERLKLAKQLKVITAQSRLSAGIVGMLPIVLAVALNFMSPGYMQLLIEDQLGRTLLTVSVVLEVLGIYVMHKMSTMRV